MSYFVVVHGPLGSGKSTLAKEIAIRLHAERVQIDDILSEHELDLHEDGEAGIPAVNFIKALNFVLPDVRQKLTNDRVVIFDGCFYHKEVMDYLLENLLYPHYVFTLRAPLEICIDRDKHRPKSLGEDAARAVYALTSKLDFGTIVDTSRSLQDSVSQIMETLKRGSA